MMHSTELIVHVIVPSVGRPETLANCLDAINEQILKADAISVVVDEEDYETIAVALARGSTIIKRSGPGLAQAIDDGFAAAPDAGIIAFTDDDAVPLKDWLLRIVDAFAKSPCLGAVGGRDNIYGDQSSGSSNTRVGLLTRTGRLIGNHELGHGPARPVLHVKGANMAFRRMAVSHVRLGELVIGQGAQHGNELFLSLAARRAGYSVVYDPSIQVDHYPALRAAGDERELVRPDRIYQDSFNMVHAFKTYGRPFETLRVALRAVTIGSSRAPGLAGVLVLLLRRGQVRRTCGSRTRVVIDLHLAASRGVCHALLARR